MANDNDTFSRGIDQNTDNVMNNLDAYNSNQTSADSDEILLAQ